MNETERQLKKMTSLAKFIANGVSLELFVYDSGRTTAEEALECIRAILPPSVLVDHE